ncbi:MAG: cobaltochelatase subunit CobN, partial [Rhodospirillales bacterium]|nr:cobaltochelatase subunit CobN [Rhodospirillales bacterium]
MHLLAAQPGSLQDGSEAVDLGQSPGDIVFITAADTDIGALAQARRTLKNEHPNLPSLRIANQMRLSHNLSVDLYVEDVVRAAKLVVVRALGGRGYWPYGIDEVARVCREQKIPVAFLPGDDQPDAELARYTTLPREDAHRLWQYLVYGGQDNAINFLKCAASLLGQSLDFQEPRPVLPAGAYWPRVSGDGGEQGIRDLRPRWREGLAVVPIIFYRALYLSGNLETIDDLIFAVQAAGLNPLPIFVASLKDPISQATLSTLLEQAYDAEVFKLGCVLNTTGFAASLPGAVRAPSPFDAYDLMVLQVVLSGGSREAWLKDTRGLGPKDIAMNVALPEVDGRVLTRAISFKALAAYDAECQCDLVIHQPDSGRIAFVAQMARRWAWLKTQPDWAKRVAIVMANYPNRDGRIGNGVGLDTPAGVIEALRAMQHVGFEVDDIPADANALIERIQAGPTNAHAPQNIAAAEHTLSLEDYRTFFATLPEGVRRRMIKQWGAPEADPFMRCDMHFAIPVVMCGEVAVGLQPARGYNIDPEKTYHDPDLVPPHGYLAFYVWLRQSFDVDAIVHFGKHGNLEWLPGRALALGPDDFPEVALGPVPHVYPFIVNDPGEGSQAKRRASAVIIDHLTPPLTRAESYGPLRDLEQLVDEYFEASGVDARRTSVLKRDILELCHVTGLGQDAGLKDGDGEDERLATLDAYLCELKEMQIRDGLHVFGCSPMGELLNN